MPSAPVNVGKLPPEVAALLDAAADRYGVGRPIARAVAWTESRGRQNRVGTSGELGVMQLMPKTAEWLEVDARSLTQNIDGGVRYLSQQLKRFGERAGLAGYNGGPGMAARLESNWPAGVQAYVRNVLARAEIEAALVREEQGARAAAVPFPPDEVTPVQRRRSPPPPAANEQPARFSSLVPRVLSRLWSSRKKADTDDDT